MATEKSQSNNVVFIVAGLIALEATEDKIIIQLDPFKSGYECKFCDGTGTFKRCISCNSTGLNEMGRACRDCAEVLIYDDDGTPSYDTSKRCHVCKGNGSLIVIPESAKALPTSGRIVSAGPECKVRKVGERVLFGAHTGYFLPFKGNIKLRIMREHEIMCRIYGIEQDIALGDFMVLEEDGNFRS